MKKYMKVLLWFIGLAIVIFLVQLPKHKGEMTWNSFPQPLAGKVIVIDPGHGGPDGGATGKNNTSEKEIALQVAEYTRDYLQQAGALVYLTRETDKDLAGDTAGYSNRKSVDIRNRLAFIEKKNADLYVTIHLNAIPQTQWSGAQTFYYPSKSENKQLAEHIQSELIHNLENTDRKALEKNGIYLLKHAETPGALVEIGFLSNEQEEKLLQNETYQKKVSASIYQGILLSEGEKSTK